LLQQHRDLARYPVRFDVIALSREPSENDHGETWRLEWMKHAFESSR
jgi:Holliday junction resolvase-like predicted endonuclease